MASTICCQVTNRKTPSPRRISSSHRASLKTRSIEEPQNRGAGGKIERQSAPGPTADHGRAKFARFQNSISDDIRRSTLAASHYKPLAYSTQQPHRAIELLARRRQAARLHGRAGLLPPSVAEGIGSRDQEEAVRLRIPGAVERRRAGGVFWLPRPFRTERRGNGGNTGLSP